MTAVVAVGSDPASNRAVLALARDEPAVRPALGLHPERFDLGEEAVEEVLAQVTASRAVLAALGEVGLPRYGLDERPDRETIVARSRIRLARLFALARRLCLPVSLHAPHETAAEALGLAEEAGLPWVAFHWHKASRRTTRAIVERGYFLGVTPAVVHRERDQALVRSVPLGSLLVESDGPWPAGGPLGQGPAEPAMVARAAATIAEVRGLARAEVLAALADNARRFLAGGA